MNSLFALSTVQVPRGTHSSWLSIGQPPHRTLPRFCQTHFGRPTEGTKHVPVPVLHADCGCFLDTSLIGTKIFTSYFYLSPKNVKPSSCLRRFPLIKIYFNQDQKRSLIGLVSVLIFVSSLEEEHASQSSVHFTGKIHISAL